MKPKKLTLCGWGPYKSIEEVDFTVFEDKGIFLITGATGSGKTTIFDAISYALYGALSGDERDKERSSTRSDFADGDTPTYVELIMEHGGETYRIRRNPEYLRPKKRGGKSGGAGQVAGTVQNAWTKEKENAILYYPDGRVLEGVREVGAAMKELLVLDYQQFKKISMIAQGEFSRLLVAPPKEKTKIFREIFDTGVFERFTQELGVRSRAAYAKIMEQRHKLEEDVRLLLVGLEKSGWSDALKEELTALTAAENWNYDALADCLLRLEQEAKEQVAASKKAYIKADGRVEKLAAQLAGLEEENARILRFLQLGKDLEALRGKAEEYAAKQERYHNAMNAGWAEGAEAKLRQVEQQLENNRYQRETVLAKRMEEASLQLQKGQQVYLDQEKLCMAAKEEYEAAERRRRIDAIGLAAELLEEGKPCPVCGSMEHPAPATITGCDQNKTTGDMCRTTGELGGTAPQPVSEEILKKLKQKLEREEKERNRLHGEALMSKTRLEGLNEQKVKLLEEAEELKVQAAEAQVEFTNQLLQYGFRDEESYRKAKLPKVQRDNLQRELESYRTKLASTEELYAHLKGDIKSAEPRDLTELQMALKAAKGEKDAALQAQKQWERHQTDAKKTSRLMDEKLEIIRRESREYGYVKDLENLASGNNSKRIVFEQYVLAGYFEEILRAANLRFAKMTGGRYEMSRLQQVGDGRIKDNLEIEVLDYYTGKYRSVRTLSGGESFKASLSLALGMSDVIQAANGGIKVDTLFVDEGFGTLDEESLDQACDTLMSLAEKKHLIGIISHVPELRQRIDRQLVVEKNGNGSKIKTRI